MVPSSFDFTDLPEFTAIRTFEYHDCLDSTNDRVKELFKQLILPKLPCLVIARQQTAGRGRGAKSWWSPDGALLMSLGFELDAVKLERNELPLLSLAAAMAVLETIGEYAAKFEVGLHWPNDVYVDDRKISGILLESPTPRHVVVGIGVNVNNRFAGVPPEDFNRLPISLIELLGVETEHPLFVRRLLVRLHDKIEKLAKYRTGFIEEAGRCCVQTGRTITINGTVNGLHGRCVGIAPDGGLLLETASGVETVHRGIVSEA